MTLPQVLEALIFAAPKPLPTAELLAAVKAAGESSEHELAQTYSKVEEAQIVDALGELQLELENSGRAYRLLEQAAGWGMVTRPEYAPWVRKLFPDLKPARLSGPAMETLAIIAYRQPVTRADIEAVRGVAVDGVMQVLLDRSLVRISGRADLPGRPLLYATTGYFLEHFGLKSVEDLPNAIELGRMDLPKAPVPEDKAAKKKETDGHIAPELPLDGAALDSTTDGLSGGEAGTPSEDAGESVSEAIREEEASDSGHSFSNEDSDAVGYAEEDTWTGEGLHVAEEGPSSEELGGGGESDAPSGEPSERGFGESSSDERDSGESAEADHDSAH